MSDEIVIKRTRTPINALKILNGYRVEKGLPKVSTRALTPKKKLSKEEKNALAVQVWKDLYPACETPDFVMPEGANEKVLAEFAKRLKALEGETAPSASYTGKPRGRKPKSV